MISSINSIRYRFHQFICRRYCHNIRSLDTIRKILDYGQPSDCYQYKVYVHFSYYLNFKNKLILSRENSFPGLDTWEDTKEKI